MSSWEISETRPLSAIEDFSINDICWSNSVKYEERRLFDRKKVSGILTIAFLLGVFVWTLNVPYVKATGTVYIRSDGTIDPPTAPIHREEDVYTFTGNMVSGYSTDGLVIERSNMTLDGAGFTLSGDPEYGGTAVILSQISNITIQNMTINNFIHGITLNNCTDCSILENTVSTSFYQGTAGPAISLSICSNINISKNSCELIELHSSSNCTLFKNSLSDDHNTLSLFSSSYNRIIENTVRSEDWEEGSAIATFSLSSNNIIYHNNFYSPWGYGVLSCDNSSNTWDDGYPSGGNYYFGYYSGIDMYNGPYQNESGSDDIGDTPCLIAPGNRDNFPLVYPYSDFDIAVTDVSFSKTVVASGSSVTINISLKNQGQQPTDFNLTVTASHAYVPRSVAISLEASASLGWNNSIPGPAIIAVEGDQIAMLLESLDSVHHLFFVDYNGNAFPDAHEPQSAAFINANTTISFTANTRGNFTYYDAYNENTLFGQIEIRPPLNVTVQIESMNVTIAKKSTSIVTMNWDTASLAKGEYVVTAFAMPVAGETSTGDNTFTNGVIKVVIPGDINGDQIVNVLDAILIANSFNSKPGDTNWNPNADINCDNKVNILDCIVLANHFGESWS